MARVWIVNPFDPLPGDPEQPGRYASLAELLIADGHDVVWWTADFSHRFKRRIDRTPIIEACRRAQIDVRFVTVPEYRSNVSIARLRSHRAFASGLQSISDTAPRPDVIIASNPPPDSAAAAAKLATQYNAKLVIDTQDIWIENWRNMLPAALRFTAPLLFAPWRRMNRAAYSRANAVVGVADRYVAEADKYGGPLRPRHTVPLGIDLHTFDAAADEGNSLLPEKPDDEIRIVYSGSFSRSYDVLTAATTAAELVRQHNNLRFVFSGRGELETEARRLAGEHDRINFLGFAPFADWAATVTQCDIGWNAIKPENLIFLPNKVFYYWAAGLAVLNSVPGECADWIERTDSGISYRCGDVASATKRIEDLISDHKRLSERRCNARDAAETRFDRALLYQPYLDLIAELTGESQ